MNLYVLRHGEAVEAGSPGYAKDSERPLTPKGERQLGRIAAGMRRLGLDFDLVLSSPYVRARQTAEIVARTLKLKKRLKLSETLRPTGTARELIASLNRLKPRPEDVLLVGHEPNLSRLISLLLSGETGLAITMKKGSLCKLSAESLRPGRCATLEWLLPPKQLAPKRR